MNNHKEQLCCKCCNSHSGPLSIEDGIPKKNEEKFISFGSNDFGPDGSVYFNPSIDITSVKLNTVSFTNVRANINIGTGTTLRVYDGPRNIDVETPPPPYDPEDEPTENNRIMTLTIPDGVYLPKDLERFISDGLSQKSVEYRTGAGGQIRDFTCNINLSTGKATLKSYRAGATTQHRYFVILDDPFVRNVLGFRQSQTNVSRSEHTGEFGVDLNFQNTLVMTCENLVPATESSYGKMRIPTLGCFPVTSPSYYNSIYVNPNQDGFLSMGGRRTINHFKIGLWDEQMKINFVSELTKNNFMLTLSYR